MLTFKRELCKVNSWFIQVVQNPKVPMKTRGSRFFILSKT